jgi:glucose-6-phosphate 1-dehydrogenase
LLNDDGEWGVSFVNGHSSFGNSFMPHTFIIFGASGDLTQRKLIPSLYQLYRKQRLPKDTRIVGFSRTEYTHDAWRADLAATTAKFLANDFDAAIWDAFAQNIFYQPGDIGHSDDFTKLAKFLNEIEKSDQSTRVYYLATAPRFYEPTVSHLGCSGLADESHGPRRVIIEKPFGTDLASSRHLNAAVHAVFSERQVYRIDHYLGKETVQNLLVLRFANTIFEPVWNRNYIDHVQITVAEEVDVGRRAGYYDTAGVVRDIIQNHMLQLLTIAAMEAPVRYEADSVRTEKVKVLQAIRPMTPEDVYSDTLRAQYDGYLSTEGVASGSKTPTFAVVKLWVDNWRWQGVPFYLRSGKAMSCRTTQIVVQFREPPHMMFSDGPKRATESNRLVIQVQPAEGIQLHFETKVPDACMKLRQTDLDFRYQREFRGTMPEAYERLLLDALEGDASLFARADEVEAAWAICDPFIEEWVRSDKPAMLTYEPGLWGPTESTDWMAAQNREWFDICPVLH